MSAAKPPEEPPGPMQTIVQHIYDEINRLRGRSPVTTDQQALSTGGDSSGGSPGGSVGEEILDGLETTIQGIPPPDTLLIRHVATKEFTISQVVVDAKEKPDSDFGLVLRQFDQGSRSMIGETPILLPAGTHNKAVALSQSVSSSSILEVSTDLQTGNWTDTLSTLTVNLEVA